MRISDWSSDVCSSDLQSVQGPHPQYRAATPTSRPAGLSRRPPRRTNADPGPRSAPAIPIVDGLSRADPDRCTIHSKQNLAEVGIEMKTKLGKFCRVLQRIALYTNGIGKMAGGIKNSVTIHLALLPIPAGGSSNILFH